MSMTTQTLRDVLFEEIMHVRSEGADTRRSVAVAKLAQQIIATARVELDYHRASEKAAARGKEFAVNSLQLSTTKNVAHAEKTSDQPPNEVGMDGSDQSTESQNSA